MTAPTPRSTRRQQTRWDTQDSAWADVQPRQGTICAELLDIIKASPRTCDEVEQFTGKPHQTVSAAINALMRDGLIRAIDKRMTRSGRQANVWHAVLPSERPAEPAPEPSRSESLGFLFGQPQQYRH